MTGYLYRGRPALEALNAQIMADRAVHAPVARPGRPDPPCGTWARYRRHCKAHEAIDEACALAALEMSRAMKERARLGGLVTQARRIAAKEGMSDGRNAEGNARRQAGHGDQRSRGLAIGQASLR